MQHFYSSLLSLSLFVTGEMVVAEGTVNAQTANQYPAEFVQNYNQECIQTSLEEGLEESEAKRLCDCTIDEFERQYNLQEFQRLTSAAATDKKAETALVEVGQFCFEQILYEQ